jgi:peptidoglycan/xylan/chitin deacetylase (PgdA/CDA1 family)
MNEYPVAGFARIRLSVIPAQSLPPRRRGAGMTTFGMRTGYERMTRRHVVLIWLIFPAVVVAASPAAEPLVRDSRGGIVRGDVSQKKLALVFTGDEFGESMKPILDTLKQRKISAGFFVTGKFLRQPALRKLIERAIAEGHYVGPHSDGHLLYAEWDPPFKSLVSEEEFTVDLKMNLAELKKVRALASDGPVFFIPPYEHYNADHVRWSKAMGVTVFNFTPGSGSNRDYMREDDKKFASSEQLLTDILKYEKKDANGLNGFFLLLHLGSGRKDPFHTQLGKLCDALAERGYSFERVDTMLKASPAEPK